MKKGRSTKRMATRQPRASRGENREATRLLMEMLAIPGSSGGEHQVQEFVRGQLLEAGAPAKAIVNDKAHRRSIHGGEVGNLILKLPGTVRGPRKLLSAHLDTVPLCVGTKPRRIGTRVVSSSPTTGLGGDDRAGASVLLHTARTLLQQGGQHGPLTFLWTVQEEVGLHGARHVQLGLLGKPRVGFNFDGGSPAKITIAATGGYRMKIEIDGVASHAGGAPEKGVSAIAIASLAIAELHRKGWHGLIKKRGKTGTSNVGVIAGGAATNVVTDRVVLKAEARSHDAQFRQAIVAQIEKSFQEAAQAVRNVDGQSGEVRIEGGLDYESFRLAPDDDSVSQAVEAIRAEGGEPELAISNGGLDANWLNAHGIPTVTLGCGQRNIHTVAEELELTEFQLACRIAARLAKSS